MTNEHKDTDQPNILVRMTHNGVDQYCIVRQVILDNFRRVLSDTGYDDSVQVVEIRQSDFDEFMNCFVL